MRLLVPYSAEQVEDGVAHVVSEYEYKTLPPFAVLKKAMDKASGILSQERALDMAAEAEWCKLCDDVSRLGRYREPTHCQTTAYVLRGMGGWDAACNWEQDKLEWRHKEFIDAWKLAHGNTHAMSLGADGIEALTASSRIESAGAIVNRVLSLASSSVEVRQ